MKTETKTAIMKWRNNNKQTYNLFMSDYMRMNYDSEKRRERYDKKTLFTREIKRLRLINTF